MKHIIDAKEAFTPDGGIATIYEFEEKSDIASRFEGRVCDANHFELADGRKLTMVGHGEYRADQTGDVFLVKNEAQPAGRGELTTNTVER